MKKYLPLLIVVVIAIGTGCSRTPSRRNVVEAYQAAHNSGNVDSVMALIYPDARADFAGMGPSLWGPDELRGKAAYDSSLHAQYSFTTPRTVGDTIFVNAAETNDWLRTAGLPANIFAKFYFVIKDGKIHYIRAELDDASIDHINGVMTSLIPWAEENKPFEFNRLVSELYLFSAESASQSLLLLSAWKSSGGMKN